MLSRFVLAAVALGLSAQAADVAPDPVVSADRAIAAGDWAAAEKILRDPAAAAGSQGRIPEAIRLQEAWIARLEQRHGPAAMKLGEPLRELAYYRHNGLRDFGPETERILRRAATLLAGPPAGNTVDRARAHAELGLVLLHQRRFADARPELDTARRLAAADPDFPTATRLLLRNIDAMLAHFTGRWSEVETINREVLEGYRRLRPGSPSEEAAMNNYAVILSEMGRHAEAEPILRDVLGRWERRYGADHARVAFVLMQLGGTLRAARSEAEALPYYRRAAEIFRAQVQLGRRDRAQAIQHYGSLLAATPGRAAESLPLIAEAIAAWEAVPGDQRSALADLHADHARALQATGAGIDAVRRALAAAVIPDGTVPRTRHVIAASLAATAAAAGDPSAAAWANQAVDAVLAQLTEGLSYTGEPARLALLLDLDPFDAPANAGDAPALARAAFAAKGAVLDSLIEDEQLAARAAEPAVAGLLAALQDARAAGQGAELTRLEGELARTLARRGEGRRALQVQPAEIQRRLGPGEGLIDYVRFNRRVPGERPARHYAALVATREVLAFFDLGPAAAIEEAVGRLQLLATHGGDETWAHDLRRLVFDPLRAALPADLRRIYVAPDAELQRVPFAALPDRDHGFLGTLAPWLTLTSARDLLPAEPNPRPEAPVILAAPAWAGALARLPALPGAAREAELVARLVPGSRLYLGAAATPAALESQRAPRLLHLATHVVWDRGTGAALALAGSDGRLTSARLAALDLRGTELVTVSACDSGGGPVAAGEGVLGLRRGFIRAGARHLLLSLWPVPDAATAGLIADFYARFQTADTATAFAAAQLHALENRRREAGLAAALRDAGAFILSGRP